MLCRFCGKKTNTNIKCDYCSKESPILLEYKSYENDPIIEKLRLLLESYDESNCGMDITVVPHDDPSNLADTSSSDTCEKNNGNDSLSLKDEADEALKEKPTISEEFNENLNPKIENYSDKKSTLICFILLFMAIIFLLLTLTYIKIFDKNNPRDSSDISDESKMPGTTTISEIAEDIRNFANTYSEITTVEMKTEASTETVETDEFSIFDNKSEENNNSLEGEYYNINKSVFSNKESSDFRNVFGNKPIKESSELYLSENSIKYNDNDYDIDIENNVVAFKNENFSKISTDFIKLFNFKYVTKFGDSENKDNEQKELYAFNISNRKVNATILCNKLGGLCYAETDIKYDNLGGISKFTISNDNNGKDSVLWVKDIKNNITIKAAYGERVENLDDCSGSVVISKHIDGYEIAKLAINGEKDIYFYRDTDSQDVYMIQYIKYNTENDGVSDAVLRE